MADKDDLKEGKEFGLGIPQKNTTFWLKGMATSGVRRRGWSASDLTHRSRSGGHKGGSPRAALELYQHLKAAQGRSRQKAG